MAGLHPPESPSASTSRATTAQGRAKADLPEVICQEERTAVMSESSTRTASLAAIMGGAAAMIHHMETEWTDLDHRKVTQDRLDPKRRIA